MYYVDVSDVVIGQMIAEPLVTANGVLLCNPGTPVSATLKRSIKKFGIDKIPVQPILNDQFDAKYLSFETFTSNAYSSVRKLEVNNIVKASTALVQNLVEDENSAMLNVLYDYDYDTYIHSMNVASLALTCAIKLGYSLRELYILAFGSTVHDIGKSDIPKEILTKKDKLTESEYAYVRKHPELGVQLLNQTNEDIPRAVKEIVLQHHENHDGTGYPRNLRDYHIYKLARLVHIADCYEALCAKRPYKEPIPRPIVRELMEEAGGIKFDPIMLKKFLKIIPMYLIGEEIEYNGVKGVIVDTADGKDPLISVDKSICRLSDLQRIKSFQKEIYVNYKDVVFG